MDSSLNRLIQTREEAGPEELPPVDRGKVDDVDHGRATPSSPTDSGRRDSLTPGNSNIESTILTDHEISPDLDE